MKSISIIIPTFNEFDNVGKLAARINAVCVDNNIEYEMIFVDDHSTDLTRAYVSQLTKHYPIRPFLKHGKKGKGLSLIEGFSKARFDIVCMIDADLQYPPEAIPAMFDKILNGADVVVANRSKTNVSFIRRLIGNINRNIIAKNMHKFDVDVQSGLKVFKKEIIERVPLNVSLWDFDLEFLYCARDAGYKIASHDIIFSKRESGRRKINLFKATFQIAISALRLRLTRHKVIPFHITTAFKKGNGFHYKGKEFIHHSSLQPDQNALHRLSGFQIFFLIDLFVIFILSLIINWHLTVVIIVSLMTTLYFADLLFNLFLIYRSFSKKPEIKVTDEELESVPDEKWPMYTVFCPLYKEWKVIPQFAKAISDLDYPKDKLQVMFLLEEDDKETISQIANLNLPSYFEYVIVPDSKPKTKPKASNYGLQFAKGEYAVIYDAEDIPDQQQLKKAILAFEKAGKRTICIQAKLNFYNPHQNLLTRIFTAEYSLWFDLVLTGLQSIHAPIPLGGTSNHFKVKDLHTLKGWDSFNVTEDADLGMRLVKLGYQTAVIQSITLEEANSSLKNWFGQRSRWVKGYIQTYFVHMRNPSEFLSTWKEPHFATFQLVIGGKVLSMFINPLMWGITICYFVFRSQIGPFIDSFFLAPVLYMGIISLLLGNFLYTYYYMVGCVKHGHDDLVKYIWLVPFYWLAMSVAAWVALYKFVVAPHHWSKTKHGLHLNKNVQYVKENISSTQIFQQQRVEPETNFKQKPKLMYPLSFKTGSLI